MCKEWLDKTGIFVNGNNVTTEENTGLDPEIKACKSPMNNNDNSLSCDIPIINSDVSFLKTALD